MATRNIVPRANGEGSLGTTAKKWGNIYAENGTIAGRNIAEDGAKLDAQGAAIEQIRVSVGTPLVANSVLDMTDTDKIYVYTGNESGYTKGDWYYWNGSAWVSGGVYNSTAFETDKTLTIEGAAADAKAAGDWLRDIAVPVTALPEIPETAFADEYMKVVVDKDNRVLYGVKRDGSFYWQKGVPVHLIDKIHEIAEPTIENDEYLYVMLDTEGRVILGVKRDGSVTWQKGTPQHVIDACNPTMESDEYLYLIKDPDDRVIFAIKRDGSVTWQKGVPQVVKDAISPTINNDEYVYLITDPDNHVLFTIKKDGSVDWQKGIPVHVISYIQSTINESFSKMPIPTQAARIFKKVCCCGDSFTSGWIAKSNDESSEVQRVNEQFAWPHYIGLITGNKWENCGASGTTVLTWQTDPRGLPKAQNLGKVQAYTVGLGLNDASGGGRVPVGTIDDVDTDAQTYYGGMSAIIRQLKAISPDAKIFLFTMASTGAWRQPYNQAVRNIVEYYKNVIAGIHCIDLEKNIDMFEKPYIVNDSRRGHYTAIGYEHFAEIISHLISAYIDSHVADFQDVAFIEYDE